MSHAAERTRCSAPAFEALYALQYGFAHSTAAPVVTWIAIPCSCASGPASAARRTL